jgi:predicted hotdog family 3-hydroxylacyl-ACP dehydratase
MQPTLSTDYIADQFPVAELLPQSGLMILIDAVARIDDDSITTEITVRDDGLFSLENKTVPAWVGIEYMAQTIAAFSGYHCLMRGEPIRLGFLLGTRLFESDRSSYPCATQLKVHASKIIESANDMCVFDSSIEIVDVNTPESPTITASAKINLLLPKDLNIFLENAKP